MVAPKATLPVDSILTLSIGILVTGLVMLRAKPGRAPGLMGVTTGVVGIASVGHTGQTGALSPLAVAASLLTIAWLLVVGIAFLRAGGPAEPEAPLQRSIRIPAGGR